ncbi:hypothetical protein KFL_005810070 [Klebsormidium nitens]|uniref:F-box/LRR-repeat protein 15-like leucin rich repeat domain-containing protein n=1 Tax=Klebsormidium nitens TaxID=105231 RepID=A0A1Y1IGE7_KLENI|nr:hypothetical protein KFL_005810070 [Klebsormidium nitens]|eukprot:GAQ89954.1 hypothetical protein KFL_005810070 [Klebsormidium nitens]
MEFFARLTPFEERVWEVIEGALALGERIAHQVSRATGDAAAGACEALFSPLCESAPDSQSSPLSSSQDVEALASSALPQEQHTCEVTSDETQGSEQTHDASSEVVPGPGRDGCFGATEGALPADGGKDMEGKEGAGSGGSLEAVSAEPSGRACHAEELGGPCSFMASASSALSFYPPFSSSPEASASCESQPEGEQSLAGEIPRGQGAEQAHDAFDDLPAPVRDELASSEQLKQSQLQAYERSLTACGAVLACEEGVAMEGSEERKGAAVLVDERGCGFANLDALCLTRIMSCLDDASLRACSLVCCEWLETSNFARHHLSLQKVSQFDALEEILERFPRIESVQVGEEEGTPIAEPPFSNASLRLVGRGCPGLRSLDLVHCSAITDAGLEVVLRRCGNLTALRLEHCENVSGTAFFWLAPCKIEWLALRWCGLLNSGLGAAAAACPELKELDVRVKEGGFPVAKGLERVAEQCPKLERVTFHTCGVTDTTLRSFATGCPLLEQVTIACEHDISDAGVAALQQHLPLLSSITLFNNRQIKKIPRSRQSPQIKNLGIGAWLETPDTVLRQVTEEGGLEDLRIASCPALTDTTVEKIFTCCRHLKHLVLAHCELLTSDVLRAYAQSGIQARLVILSCKGLQESMLPADMRFAGKVSIT